MTIGAVSDAGPLIHLGEIESLDLLSAFDPLLIPETVYEEVESGGRPDGLSDLSSEFVVADENEAESTELDPGNAPR